MDRRFTSPTAQWIGLAVLGAVAVFATYGESLHYGLAYDDYFLTRPWTRLQLERVWHSTWDPTRISVAFYRPLTAWWYALRFELFGLNGVPQHAVSLVLMAICATLAGLFVWREVRSRSAAAIATLLYAIHPGMAYGQAVWLTNQMHLLASLFVLLGLVAWQTARTRTAVWWLLVLACQAIAFGIKEDTVMLAPAILGLVVLRRILVGDVPWPHWMVLAIGAATPVALYQFRLEVLGRLGGYGAGWPGWETAWSNFSRGFGIFALLPARRPWQMTASLTARAILFAGGAISLLRRQTAYLFLAGLWLFAAFNLPFVLVTKAEQGHLITFGVVIALTACVEAIVTISTRPWLQWTAAALVAVPLGSLMPLARHMGADFAPCAATTISTDAIATGWSVVPPEVNAWLRDKPRRCADGTLRPLTQALETATWAYWPELDETQRIFQWTAAEASVLVRETARSMDVEIRRPRDLLKQPVAVTLTGPAGTTSTTLANGDWTRVTVPLTRTWRTALSDMHHVTLVVSDTFYKNQFDRAATDSRRLGVQMRIAGIR